VGIRSYLMSTRRQTQNVVSLRRRTSTPVYVN